MLFSFSFIVLVPLVLSEETLELRIVGGEETTIEDYPYQVLIRIQNRFICGGFIVSKDHILTAAHCFYGFVKTPADFEVRASTTFRDGGTVIPIKEFRIHPDYGKNKTSRNDKDIACLRTSSPLQFSTTVQPIGLPPVNRTVTGNVTVTGWGYTQYNSTTLPRTLMAVEIPVANRSLCEKTYGPGVVTSNMWCGGNYETGGGAPCQGDSGGPAVQDGMAVGCVSFGSLFCGAAKQPSVFTDLAAQPIVDFISDCFEY